MNSEWKDEEIVTATEVLRESFSIAGACAQMQHAIGRDVTPSALRCAFQRRKLPTPGSYLGSKPRVVDGPAPRVPTSPPKAPKDPVVEHRLSSANSHLRAENKRLLELIDELREREAFVSSLKNAPMDQQVVIPRRERTSALREGAYVALLSDTHVDEIVEPDDSTHWNAYSPEIADLRLNRFWQAVDWQIRHKRQTFTLRDVVIWLGGDNTTGHIHAETVETTQGVTPIETLLWLLPRLEAGLRLLLADAEIETLTVMCSYGNHGRDTTKPYRARGAAHSYEWLGYKHLESRFAEEIEAGRVKFITNPKGHQYMRLYDATIHATHGDEVRFKGGVGGLVVPLNKAIYRWNAVRAADLHLNGHFHQRINGRNFCSNGSGIGFNDFAMSIGAEPEPAQQSGFVWDAKRGRTEEAALWLEDRAAENAVRLARGWPAWPSR